ncbi:MAG TPA: cellulase family glycosylhydrolase [Solirubrobacteraceae bacterium]|nr:cellulase family glycosylhydrolase [Solirubrobacteraceae bacterium]
MRRRQLNRMLVLAATLAACAAQAASFSAPAGAAATPSQLLGGVNVMGITPQESSAAADRAIAVAKSLHAKVVRTDAAWAEFEPKQAGELDQRTLEFADRLVNDAAAAGIKVVMTVESSPCWATTAPHALLAKCTPGRLSKANAYPPRDPAAYASFAAFLAARYGSKLAAIEIWNEPDQSNELYFAGPEKPARYAAVLRAAYPAIKQVAPSLQVLAGSLVGSNGAFLKALYKAGIKGFYDGLSVHFYNLTLASVRSIHEVQLANGDATPLWLAEFGWTSCYPHKVQQEQGCVTTATQAANLSNMIRSLARAHYLAAAIVYKLQDSTGENFGMLAAGGAHKPSFGALSQVLRSPTGSISPVTLTLSRSGSHVVASGSGPVGDFMRLEAFVAGALRFRAIFTLNRFNRFKLSLPAVLGTTGLRIRVFQYWAGGGHAAQKQI